MTQIFQQRHGDMEAFTSHAEASQQETHQATQKALNHNNSKQTEKMMSDD